MLIYTVLICIYKKKNREKYAFYIVIILYSVDPFSVFNFSFVICYILFSVVFFLFFILGEIKKPFSLFCKCSCLDIQNKLKKNVAYRTFKGRKSVLHDQYLLGRYPKLGGQSRITYVVTTIFIFARFVKDILGVTIFS